MIDIVGKATFASINDLAADLDYFGFASIAS